MSSAAITRMQLRKITATLTKIQAECDPQGAKVKYEREDGQEMDPFERTKRDLTAILVELKESIDRWSMMMESHGRHPETIRLKSRNEKQLSAAKSQFNELRALFAKACNKKRVRDDIITGSS